MKQLFVSLLSKLAHIYTFIIRVFKGSFRAPFAWREFFNHCYWAGNSTVWTLGFVSVITGFLFAKASEPALERFGEEALLPGIIGIGIIRSLGPLITALICAGKLGATIGSDLGSIDSIRSTNPDDTIDNNSFHYVVITRVLAVALMLPVLVILSDLICLLGGFLFVNFTSDTNISLYFLEVFDNITITDLITALIKPFFFGLGIGTVSTYSGYYSSGDSRIGKAATTSVVYSMVTMFIIDFIFIQVVQFINQLSE